MLSDNALKSREDSINSLFEGGGDRVSCPPSFLQTHYVAKENLELLIFFIHLLSYTWFVRCWGSTQGLEY